MWTPGVPFGRLQQRRPRALGYRAGRIDGIYGPQTAAVEAFQMSEGLVPDGEVGTRTASGPGVEWVDGRGGF